MIGRQKPANQEEPSQVVIDMSRTFTLSEAESLLPILESLLRTAMQSKATIEEVEAEL